MPRKKEFDTDIHIKGIKEDMNGATEYAKWKGTTVSDLVRKYIKRLAKKVKL